MTPEQVLEVYDRKYAAAYDDMWIVGKNGAYREKTKFELRMLQGLTKGARTWLDTACGTGFFQEFGRGDLDVRCTGLDLSAEMLAIAKQRETDAEFIHADFLDDRAARFSHYDVVTNLWLAYTLQDTEYDISRLIHNMARWTRPGGICYMTVLDPEIHSARAPDDVHYSALYGETAFLDEEGTRWTYTDLNGVVHEDVVSPPLTWIAGIFQDVFGNVRLIDYPTEYPMIKGMLAVKPGGDYAKEIRE